jgi:hypothetical protein
LTEKAAVMPLVAFPAAFLATNSIQLAHTQRNHRPKIELNNLIQEASFGVLNRKHSDTQGAKMF